jgi:hypothetical protein
MKTKIKWLIVLGIVAVIAIFVIFFLPKIIGDTVYPLKYKGEIKDHALAYKVNPNLIAGMIQVESGFNTYATSPVGARGLMQIMPATGAGLARELGDRSFSYNKLYNPGTSIKYGTYYIKGLLDKYHGNEVLATTGYNGGVSAADYLATYGTKSGLSAETSSYSGKIIRTKQIYQKLYGNWWEKKEGEGKQKVKPLEFLKNLLRPEPSLIEMVITWLMPK